jgi:Phospholipase_D-nuclease N-terminal/Short C-terminal domain
MMFAPPAGERLLGTQQNPVPRTEEVSVLVAEFTFLDVFWSMLVFFLWIAWFLLLFHVIGDIFRRRDASGGKKALWIVFVIVLPFLGVLAYLIANSDDMARRNIQQAQTAQAEMDDYVRSVAGSDGAAGEIERAKGLLDSGAITQAEFEAIKAKALA